MDPEAIETLRTLDVIVSQCPPVLQLFTGEDESPGGEKGIQKEKGQ